MLEQTLRDLTSMTRLFTSWVTSALAASSQESIMVIMGRKSLHQKEIYWLKERHVIHKLLGLLRCMCQLLFGIT